MSAASQRPAPRPRIAAGPACPQCGSHSPRQGGRFCPDCGYYPELGFTTDLSVREEVRPETPTLLSLVPGWVWWSAIGAVVILCASAAARWAAEGSNVQWYAALGEIAFGLIAAGTVHIRAFFVTAADHPESRPLDLVWEPVQIWKRLSRQFPAQAELAVSLVWGLTLIFCGFVVVDGIPYEKIGEFVQSRHRPKPNVMKTVAELARTTQAGDTDAMSRTEDIIESASAPGQSTGSGSLEDSPEEIADAPAESTTAASGGSGKKPAANSRKKPGKKSQAASSTNANEDQSAAGADQQSASADDESKPTGEVAEPPMADENPKADRNAEGTDPNGDPRGDEKMKKDGADQPMDEEGAGDATPAEGSDAQPDAATKSGQNSTKRGTGTPSVPTRPTLDCQFFGYLTNAEGELRSVLLAGPDARGNLQFVCKLPVDSLSPERRDEIRAYTERAPFNRPLVRSPYRAKWVVPVACTVEYTGRDRDGQLTGVVIRALQAASKASGN